MPEVRGEVCELSMHHPGKHTNVALSTKGGFPLHNCRCPSYIIVQLQCYYILYSVHPDRGTRE